MELFLTLITAIIGGLVVVGGWLLIIGRKFQILDDVKEKVDELKKEVGNIEGFSRSAANAIVEIQTHLTGKGFVINQRLAYVSKSPIRLTDYGETMMRESGFYDALKDEANKKTLIDLVRAKKPQTNYDIQQFSTDVIQEAVEKNHPIAIKLKNYTYEKGLPLEIVVNSAGIVLRDEVMKELKFSDSF